MQLLRLPQTTGAPSLHVLAALGVMKPATFEKTDKHRPDRGKPLILKWFPSSSPWGEQLGCSGGHSCSRCLRVSTRQESSASDSSGFSGMNPGAFCSTPGARRWEWALCALLWALSSLKLRGFFVYPKISLHTSLASFAFGTVLSFHNYFHRMGSFKLNSIKFKEKNQHESFFWESTGLGLSPQHSSWLYEKSALSLQILCFLLAYQLHCFRQSLSSPSEHRHHFHIYMQHCQRSWAEWALKGCFIEREWKAKADGWRGQESRWTMGPRWYIKI